MNFTERYNNYKSNAEEYFVKSFFEKLSNSSTDEGIKYSFFAGGKRIRPILMLAFADYFGVNYNDILPFALAIECVHVHSLIHDDLPQLDNDNFRRGKPCLHRVYGDAVAILSGDALLNYAYMTALKSCDCSEKVHALQVLADNTNKMLFGQSLDTSYSKDWGIEKVLEVYENKTSALITAAIIIPATLKNLSELFSDLNILGKNLGLLFQVTDDLIDYDSKLKTESEKQELNFVEMFGVEKGLKLKFDVMNECYNIADKFKDFEFLKLFIDYVAERSF